MSSTIASEMSTPCTLRTSLTPRVRALILVGTAWIPPGREQLLPSLHGSEGGQRSSGGCSTGCEILRRGVLCCTALPAVCRECPECGSSGACALAWKQLRGESFLPHAIVLYAVLNGLVQTIVWLDLDALHIMFDASANRFLSVSQPNFFLHTGGNGE